MNWADNGQGGDFKKTLDYVLHDKGGRTMERVGAVETLNLAEDTYHAHAEMEATHEASPELKRRAGVKNHTTRSQKPVFHYSLSWHPDDKPDTAHMMAEARRTLKLLGLQDHQAVIAEHTDRPHKHLHVVVSLVSPEHGRTAGLSHYKLKLDRWAHEYEAARQIRSPKRAARHEGRKMEKTFDARKEEITRVMRERKAEMKQKHEAARSGRNEQKDAMWKKFKADKDAIYETHQAELDELWRRKPTTPTTEPKPPPQRQPGSELKLWAKAMMLLAPDHHRPDAKRNFREALAKIAPADNSLKVKNEKAKNAADPLEKRRPAPPRPGLSGKWSVIDERRDVMLPIRNTPEARRYAAAARQSRKQRSDDIRKARDQEIRNRVTTYEREKADLDKKHLAEIKAEKRETARFNQGMDRLWQDLGREFGLKGRAAPEWLKERQTVDAKTLADAKGDVSKEFDRKAARPEVQAVVQKQAAARTEAEEAAQASVDAIVAKGLKPDMVPYQDAGGKVRNIQFMRERGHSPFIKDAPTKDVFHRIDGGEQIVICGSYKSGKAIHQATGATCVVAPHHHEMSEVARITREQNPNARMIVAPDRGEHWTNMGMPDLYKTQGKRAAEASAAKLVVPDFGKQRGETWADLGPEATVAAFPPVPAPEQTTSWRDAANEQGWNTPAPATSPEPTQTGSWRDAANGPDWSTPVPDQGIDRDGGRGM